MPGDTSGVIYRNGITVFHAPYSIGEAVGSADAMHYTAVVDGFSATLVHDGNDGRRQTGSRECRPR